MRLSRLAFLWASALAFLVGILDIRTLEAQVKNKAEQKRLQNEVTVTVKLIQVFVTDGKGNPIRDLEMPDFVLYDNGRGQAVTGFEKHFMALPAVTLAETKPAPPREVPSLMNRKFFFIIDFQGNDLEGIGKSRTAIIKFLDTQTQPGDEFALLTYSQMKGLAIHVYLTSDGAKIRTALGKALDMPGITPSGGLMNSGLVIISGTAVASSGRNILVQKKQTDPRWFADCLENLVSTLSHLPGQKNILLFSRGFQYNPANPKVKIQRVVQ